MRNWVKIMTIGDIDFLIQKEYAYKPNKHAISIRVMLNDFEFMANVATFESIADRDKFYENIKRDELERFYNEAQAALKRTRKKLILPGKFNA